MISKYGLRDTAYDSSPASRISFTALLFQTVFSFLQIAFYIFTDSAV